MRNGWRVLFNRSVHRLSSTIPRIEPPHLLVRSSHLSNCIPFPLILSQTALQSPRARWFSSELAVDPKKDQDHALLAENFSKSAGSDEIKAKVDPLNLNLDQETVHSVLRSLKENPENARKFLDWVLEREVKESPLLSSKSCKLILQIVGKKGKADEFFSVAKILSEKGFVMPEKTVSKVLERFKSEGTEKDLSLLDKVLSMRSPQITASSIHKLLLKEQEEPQVIQSKLHDLGIDLFSDLVVDVLDQISSHPKKALIFFQWVEENPSFQIDQRVANAMARVLGREDCIKDFWEIINKMRNSRFGLERVTYVKVVNRFYKRKMIVEAVELYEFAMGGPEKPLFQDFLFLLKKVVAGKELDLSLVSKVVRVYTDAGLSIKSSAFDGVLKSLRSVGKLGECDKVLKAMEEGGFVADTSVHNGVVVGFSDAGKLSEALEYFDKLERSAINLEVSTWSSFVKRLSLAGQLDKALLCLKKMITWKGGENVGGAFDVLVHELCLKKKAKDAFKTLKQMVTKENVKPWHATYKSLIERLLSQGNIREASSLLKLMKGHGFPPYVDPFIGYVSKSGTANDAMIFLKSMTTDEFPATPVFIRLFEALFKEGRHQVAHDLHSSSPGSVRNHADVLEIFYSMRSDDTLTAAAL